MADSEGNNLRKYCLKYYNNKLCSNGSTCQYIHKLRYEVEPIAFLTGEDFFIGQLPLMTNQRPCYFYRLGKCIYQDKCRFLHDNDNSLRNGVNNLESSSEPPLIECINLPSTSSQPNQEDNLHLMSQPTTDIGNETSSENKDLEGTESQSDSNEGACASSNLVILNNSSWADAPEFVPRSEPKSYAQVLGHESREDDKTYKRKLCPYTTKDGICINLGTCTNVHGDYCDMCARFVLHPYNEVERKQHQQECLKQHEKNMEISFAIQRSKEKSCGVCFEVIMEKADGEQRFGILPNCNHCFCLTCIRKWRQARQFENKIIRACPECRVTSDFVCPSIYWVDTKEDKDKLIEDYKTALARKDCKYFRKGEGKCPFGNKCFYMHAGPDGKKIDVGPPPRQRRQRNVDADMDVLQVMLWDFLDERDFPWQSLADDLEDLVSFFTESDESDWSDYELFLD